jgi:uncharacterized protein YjbI with pentapeptide repeats
MADPDQLALLKQSVYEWNAWREAHPDVRVNLNRANFSGAYLIGARLSNTNLLQADLRYIDFSRATLNEARLSNTNLLQADLSGADLTRADLNGASLTRANLSYANLSKADLNGARLSKANLSGARLSNTRLDGADLTKANLSGVGLSGVSFTMANLSGISLSRADLRKADLRGADLRKANLSRANLSGADLRGTDLSEADLRGTGLRGADLGSANLSGADLRGANLSSARLRGANLSYTDLHADLTNADLTSADLTGARHGPPSPPLLPAYEPVPSDWFNIAETVGSNILLTAAALGSVLQALDVVERRWREGKEKAKQKQPRVSPASEKEIVEILLIMDDGSRHNFKQWLSNPDALRAYIDAFNDPTSKVKPFQVIFRRRKGNSLMVDVTEGGKDNKQLNVILGYLEADPH